MPNPKVNWWSPDKIIKDLIWDDLVFASKYARGRLLDIGCGDKPYETIFSKKTKEYIGIDKNGDAADIKKDFLKAKLSSDSFDTVLLTQVLEHSNDPKLFLKKINKVIRKKGILIMTVPLIGSLHEIPNDYFRFTKFSIKYLLEDCGFKPIIIKEEGNWVSSIGNLTTFYLESTLNRFLVRYPKKLLQSSVQFIFYAFSLLPSRFTKPDLCPINYLVVAEKYEDK